MLLAHELWTATVPGATADEETWSEALAIALDATRDEAKTIWNRLTTVERQVLTAVAENQGGLYAKTSRSPRSGSTARAAQLLADAGETLADTGSRSGYRVVDPLLALWLRSGRPS